MSDPSFTLIEDREPELGAGTSTVILSVSISTRASSTSKDSPTFFNHLDTVASVMDSPSVGTINSTDIIYILSIILIILFNWQFILN